MHGLHVLWFGVEDRLAHDCVAEFDARGAWVSRVGAEDGLRRRLAVVPHGLDTAIVDARAAVDTTTTASALSSIRVHSPAAPIFVLWPHAETIATDVGELHVLRGPVFEREHVVAAVDDARSVPRQGGARPQLLGAIRALLRPRGRPLPRQQCVVVVMRLLGVGPKQSAAVLGLSEATVQGYLNKARDRLGWDAPEAGHGLLLEELSGDLVSLLSELLDDAELATRIAAVSSSRGSTASDPRGRSQWRESDGANARPRR